MGYYAIGALIVVAGALGIAYVTVNPFDSVQDQTEQAAVPEVQGDDQATADPAPKPSIANSAARRMDDFGSGPSGTTVTVPLKGRHQQAFSGSKASGGGGPKATSNPASDIQDVETAAIMPETADGDVSGQKPSFRVIERDVGDEKTSPNEEASAETNSDAEIAPSFDVVRVDPEGRTIIAGRAAPLTNVEIKAGSEVIDRVTTSAAGEWVSTPSEALSSGDQELSLTAIPQDGAPIDSRQIVVVSVPEATTETEPDQPVAVVLDKDEGGEGRILQAPDKLQSAGDERLALKLVDYDDEGAIRLSGEAPPGVPVRIYVDNEPSALVIGNSKGYWITTLDRDLPAGDYVLRLDQLDAKGQTIARLETPLTRVATPPAEGDAKVDYVVVQPGNSLWRIARRLSGDGFNYVYIYEANEAQIRDPDIIYPGQVFEVPTKVSAEIAG